MSPHTTNKDFSLAGDTITCQVSSYVFPQNQFDMNIEPHGNPFYTEFYLLFSKA